MKLDINEEPDRETLDLISTLAYSIIDISNGPTSQQTVEARHGALWANMIHEAEKNPSEFRDNIDQLIEVASRLSGLIPVRPGHE